MIHKTPPLGSRGLFEINKPFKVDNKTIYKVVAHRKINDIVLSGEDPYKEIYEPKSVSKEDYHKAILDEDLVIISLVDKNEDHIFIPSNYIVSYPDSSVVPHKWLVAVCSLGMLPIDFDLDGSNKAIQEVISDIIGVEARVYFAERETKDAVTQAQAEQLQSIRESAIKHRTSTYAQKLKLEKENKKLSKENTSHLMTIRNKEDTISRLTKSIDDEDTNYAAQIVTLNNKVGKLEQDIATKSTTINDLNTEITGLNSQVDGLTSDVSRLEDANEAMKKTISNQLGQITSLTNKFYFDDLLTIDCLKDDDSNLLLTFSSRWLNKSLVLEDINSVNPITTSTVDLLISELEALPYVFTKFESDAFEFTIERENAGHEIIFTFDDGKFLLSIYMESGKDKFNEFISTFIESLNDFKSTI